MHEILRSADHQAMPLVSVVVSTRNHAAWLSAMVHAVMEQSLPHEFELIICDNASTDATAVIMRNEVARARRPLTYVRLQHDLGAAGGRNVGITYARGAFIAFTDSDCIPSAVWLAEALEAFDDNDIGIVQGKTVAAESRPPLFSHFIETARLDGHFSTSNVVYRASALGNHRFDRRCWYWEDTDLGWRVVGSGWRAVFAAGAVVKHQIIRLSPGRWVLWPRRFHNWPAKARRYPTFRRHLFLGVWVRPLHLCYDLALIGMLLGVRQRLGLVLALPYLASFGRTRGLGGRFPAGKLAAHIAWDTVAFASLVLGSIRYRAVVL